MRMCRVADDRVQTSSRSLRRGVHSPHPHPLSQEAKGENAARAEATSAVQQAEAESKKAATFEKYRVAAQTASR
jgi:hypothetical protein